MGGGRFSAEGTGGVGRGEAVPFGLGTYGSVRLRKLHMAERPLTAFLGADHSASLFFKLAEYLGQI